MIVILSNTVVTITILTVLLESNNLQDMALHHWIPTVCVVHLADIKFGDLGANTSWLIFNLANQLSYLDIQLTTNRLAARLAVILI